MNVPLKQQDIAQALFINYCRERGEDTFHFRHVGMPGCAIMQFGRRYYPGMGYGQLGQLVGWEVTRACIHACYNEAGIPTKPATFNSVADRLEA